MDSTATRRAEPLLAFVWVHLPLPFSLHPVSVAVSASGQWVSSWGPEPRWGQSSRGGTMQTGGLVFVFCPRRGSGWRPTFSTLPCSSQQEVSASPAAGPPWGRRTCPRCQRAWLPALPRSSPAVSLWLFSVGRLIAAHQALGPVAAQVLMPPGEGGQGAAPLTGGCRNHGSAQECHMLGPEPGSWRPLCDLEQRSRPRGARGRCGRPSPHPRLTWAGGGDDVLLARAPPPSLPGPACAAQVLGVVGVASAPRRQPWGEIFSRPQYSGSRCFPGWAGGSQPAPHVPALGSERPGWMWASWVLVRLCL